MDKTFVYGMAVEGDNFTDRTEETARLKMNFENGINTVLISPRRMGKTSLVKKAAGLVNRADVKIVMMDIYDCRSEYEFYDKFASAVLQQTAGKLEQLMEEAGDFLARLSPKIAFGASSTAEYSISLGITPKTHNPQEVLNLPEKIAERKGIHIIVCIDEFQQIGEMTDSVGIQRRIRSVWQHQQNVSYCLFGSKRHMMINIFQSYRMPFYQFGDIMFLDKIGEADWTQYIRSRFNSVGKEISEEICGEICRFTDRHSSYVQQLSWNVLAETESVAGEDELAAGEANLLAQCSSLFEQQTATLSGSQMNFLRAMADGVVEGFTSKAIQEEYDLGTKSNVARIRTALVKKELIEIEKGRLVFADPIFAEWFRRRK